MPTLGTTHLSAKGQVVIPEQVRDRMGLRKGDQFVVVGERDVIMLKTVSTPSMKDFDELIAKTRRQAKLAGLKKSDVRLAIAKARRHR